MPHETINRRVQNERRIEGIESALLKHPLIIFPYLQSSAPTKVSSNENTLEPLENNCLFLFPIVVVLVVLGTDFRKKRKE